MNYIDLFGISVSGKTYFKNIQKRSLGRKRGSNVFIYEDYKQIITGYDYLRAGLAHVTGSASNK